MVESIHIKKYLSLYSRLDDCEDEKERETMEDIMDHIWYYDLSEEDKKYIDKKLGN